MRTRTILTFLSILPFLGQGQNKPLDSLINQIMAQNHVAGLAACGINNGKVTWSGNYGYQNREQKKPVTQETLFAVASTSKTVTTAALMKLYGAAKFKLTDDINKYLPFQVANPSYPNVSITFGQLLRHRSSIRDNLDYLGPFWSVNKGDPTIPLDQFLKEYLSVGGKHYEKAKNFYLEKPDSAFHYSNMGFALVGYLVERIAGIPFDQYCQTHLFKPLQMDHSAWYLKGVDSNRVAMPYHFNDSLQRYVPMGHVGYPDYPAGQLRTSAEEFAHFLISWTQQGKFSGQQVFQPGTIRLVTPPDFNMGFYTWFLHATDRGEILYNHTGGDTGVRTFICFNPTSKKGAIILMNSDNITRDGYRTLANAIYTNIP